MSPFMAPIVLTVLIGAVVFVVGLVTRKLKFILIGAPAALLVVAWLFLASSRPNPQREFDRVFGSENRAVASEIETVKPTMMNGHFISFRIRPSEFDARIRPHFSEIGLGSPSNILLGESLPEGWPSEIEAASSALHRKLNFDDIFLLYFPRQEMAYASVRYDEW